MKSRDRAIACHPHFTEYFSQKPPPGQNRELRSPRLNYLLPVVCIL
ncbi:hypothetical protein LKK83_09180 [Phormidium sp. CCY1219]|nr:hypothetical protein [Phormidium sp. CCY1219]